jgi:hypothetical protein
MTYHWRLQGIPELRDMPGLRRRCLWREAVTRSTTPARLLASLATIFTAALAGGAASIWLLPMRSTLWLALPAVMLASLAVNAWIRQPAARQWLREHAHELDRYVPA